MIPMGVEPPSGAHLLRARATEEQAEAAHTGDVASDTVPGGVCQNTTLIDNSATVSGGAAYIMEAASVESTGCTYIGNSATTGCVEPRGVICTACCG